MNTPKIVEAEDMLIREHSIAIPFPDPRPDPNSTYHLSYDQPGNINVVGSHARKAGLPAEELVVIDLAVTMPSVREFDLNPSLPLTNIRQHIFEKKDYLNYRYYYKKAYYLACIAAGIQNSSKSKSTLTFALQNDNHLQPILLINACAGTFPCFPSSILIKSCKIEDANYLSKSKCQVRVILAAAEDLFPKVKTLPDRSCIRLKDQGKSPLDCINSPTPFYNATLRSECSTLPYLKLLDQSSKGLVAFRDTCILGGIWLQQRGLTTGLANGGFGQFEWACIVALLLQGGGSEGKPFLSKSHESYLLMKATLKFIAATDLILHPLIVGSGNAKFMNQNGPVLFDSERGMNILFKMTKWSYYMVSELVTIVVICC